jgi:hypothetical protein
MDIRAVLPLLVFEAIGNDMVRVNCSSWEDSKVILADEALQVVTKKRSPSSFAVRLSETGAMGIKTSCLFE